MNQMVQIQNQEIQMKEFNGLRVVTFKDIDLVHERPTGTARKRFNDNRQRFIEGEDFMRIQKSEKRTLEFEIPNRGLTLITESGYMMLVKSFTDALAWEVQRQLVNCYFRVKEEICATVEVREQEELTKKDYLKILDCISRTSNEGFPLLRIFLNKLAPGEFESMRSSSSLNVKIKFPNDFTHKLVTGLQENHMNQKQLADKIGCTKSSINNYVHGRSKPSEYVVDKISEVLNIDFYK